MSAPVRKTISIGTQDAFPGPEIKKTLSIELMPDGFSFCILDEQSFKYLALESYRATQALNAEQWIELLDQVVKGNPLLTAQYQRINISLYSTQLILVPYHLFSHAQKDVYYKFANNLSEGSQVLSDRLNNLEAYGQYSMSSKLKKKLDFLFPDHRMRHSGTVLVESLLATLQLNEWDATIVLNISSKHFDIVLFDERKMKYYNSFSYQEFDDLMYYLFFVLEQFELTAGSMDALLVGEISLDSERFHILSQYFRKVSFAGRNDAYHYSRQFDSLPHHYFYTLLNMNSCG